MKHSTEYMFGVPREYFEPEITIVAKKKIAKARELMANISCAKNRASERAMPNLIHRYQVAEKALAHWTEILGEE